MTAVWLIGGIVMIALGTVFAVGAVLPRDHVASGSILVKRHSGEVYSIIRNAAEHVAWRKGVTKVEIHDGPGAAPQSWTEHNQHGSLKMRLGAERPGSSLTTVIDDEKLFFGGSWVFELTPENGGTRVRITENGFVKPAPFRFIAKFVMGHDATLRQFLNDLAGKLGESTKLEQ